MDGSLQNIYLLASFFCLIHKREDKHIINAKTHMCTSHKWVLELVKWPVSDMLRRRLRIYSFSSPYNGNRKYVKVGRAPKNSKAAKLYLNQMRSYVARARSRR